MAITIATITQARTMYQRESTRCAQRPRSISTSLPLEEEGTAGDTRPSPSRDGLDLARGEGLECPVSLDQRDVREVAGHDDARAVGAQPRLDALAPRQRQHERRVRSTGCQ